MTYCPLMFSVVPFGPSQRSVCEPLTNSNGVRWKQASVTGSDVFLHSRYAGDKTAQSGQREGEGARPLPRGGEGTGAGQ